jgi:hypothetical protein
MTARLDRDLEVVFAREGDRRRDLLRSRRARDDRRPTIVDRVPETARLVVACMVRRDDVGARSAQLIEVAWRQVAAGVDHRSLPMATRVSGRLQP